MKRLLRIQMEFKYTINQKVKIKELEWTGTVKQICVTERGIQYQVRYFWNMESKEVFFYEEELDPV